MLLANCYIADGVPVIPQFGYRLYRVIFIVSMARQNIQQRLGDEDAALLKALACCNDKEGRAAEIQKEVAPSQPINLVSFCCLKALSIVEELILANI